MIDNSGTIVESSDRSRISGSGRAGKSASTSKSQKSISEPVQTERNKIVVAIDFGTTYSGKPAHTHGRPYTLSKAGIAFVSTTDSDANDIQVITDWAGAARKNDHLEKVPSRIAFAYENDSIDCDKWGYEVEPSLRRRCSSDEVRW